ncbi:MAG: CDP-archaeol synthase [Gammaproteobacteria bacterium]|nr:CDP-archaeol synthase [Gammaproteobacteria bacterium]
MILLIKLLTLIILANSAPIFGRKLFNERFNQPLDRGKLFIDGAPLLGKSKTIRGIVMAAALTTPMALLLGFSATTGIAIALAAMAGDLLSSFIKRRLKKPPSSQALGLDQIPESLLPLLAVQQEFSLGLIEISLSVVAFTVFELTVSPMLHKLKIRKKPY